MGKGCFVISLDYELVWGLIEKECLNTYCRTNVRNVGAVIDRMLGLFDKYEVKATFAVVGMLMCNDDKELKQYTPNLKPSYKKVCLSPYYSFINTICEEDYLYFSPMTVEKLRSQKNIELGTHTFCHYYCLEEGQTKEEFEQDLIAAIKLADDRGIKLRSIVFPRNHVNKEYLNICFQHGIICYRGNATKFFNKPHNRIGLLKNRLGRLMDSYLPLNTESCYDYQSLVPCDGYPVNIPASRFFRPYDRKLAILEPLRMQRIKREIIHAAKYGKLYHLWWHPHNFGDNMEENIANLDSILNCFVQCRGKYGMVSYTMSEIAEIIQNKNNE